jgi:hypothetical protein
VQALVFCLAVSINDTSGHLRRMKSSLDDAVAVIDAALAVGEGEAEFAVGARQPMLAQRCDHHRRQRHGAFPCG